MTNDPSFDDLTTLFQAEDEALNDEAFTEGVMQKVKRRKQTRRILLAIAGGAGGVLSLPHLFSAYADWPASESLTGEFLLSLQDQLRTLSTDNPLWFMIGAMVLGVLMLASSLERA